MELTDITKAIGDGLTSLKDEVKSMFSPIEERLQKAEQKMDAIEKTAVKAAEPKGFFIRSEGEYKGFDLKRQGFGETCDPAAKQLGAEVQKNPEKYEVLSTPEGWRDWQKFCINLRCAMESRNTDAEAIANLKAFERAHKTTMDAVTGANGAYLVPDIFAADVVMFARDRTWAVNECTVIPVDSDQTYFPAELTLQSVAWKTHAAGQQMSGTEGTFAQVSLATKPLTGLGVMTNSLLRNTNVDIVSILTNQLSYGTLLELDNQVLNGTGTPISGVLTAAAGYSTVMATGSTNFSSITADKLNDLIDQIDEGFEDGAKFIMNKRVLGYLKTKQKETTGGYIFAQPGGVTPSTIWEYPYIKTSKAPKTSATSTAFVSFGNFKYLFIGRRLGSIAIEFDPYGRFDYNETRYRVVTEWALAIAQSKAFTRLITSGS